MKRFLEGACLGIAGFFLLLGYGAVRLGGKPADPRRLRWFLRRWVRLARNGLLALREYWYSQFQLEKYRDVLRHIFLLECVELMHYAGVARTGEQGGVLVIKLGHFGDAMHVLPVLKSMRRQLHGKPLDFLVGPWCASLALRAGVDGIHVYAPHWTMFSREGRKRAPGILSELNFLRQLAARHYELTFSTSTTNLPEFLLIRAAGAGKWTGIKVDFDLYPEPGDVNTTTYDSEEYETDRLHRLSELAGFKMGRDPFLYPVTPADRIRARDLLLGEGLSAGDRLVMVAPGAGWPGKIWPVERMAALCRRLVHPHGLRPVLVGAPSERALSAAIRREVPSALDLTGCTRIEELPAVLEHGLVFVGNDSAPMHMAAAVGVPTVSIFGPTSRGKWAPRGKGHAVLQGTESCRGCLAWHPSAHCVHESRCMKAVSVDEVESAVLSSLRN